MSKTIWSTYVPELMPAWIWVIFMLLFSRCCIWFLCMSAQLSTHLVMRNEKCVLFKKFPVLLISPDRLFLVIAAAPLCYCLGLNTSEFLGVPALSDRTWTRLSVDSR
jgi:hypothetical protein